MCVHTHGDGARMTKVPCISVKKRTMVISMRLKFVFLASCTTQYVIIWELFFFFFFT